MAGWSVSPETYETRNKSASEAVSEYQDHYTNHPNRYHLLIDGDNQMNPEAIQVQIKGEQGNFVIPVNGNWGSYVFNNDLWTGACDFSE